MFRRWSALLVLLLVAASGWVRAEERKDAPHEWRVLLIIKPETDLTLKGQPAIKSRISNDNVHAVSQAFSEFTPYWVSKVSEGRLAWKPKVVVSPNAVRDLTQIGDSNNYWLAPWDIQDDIAKYVPRAAFDGVFVYFKAVDDKTNKGINVGFGWSIGPNENANHCGFSSIHHGATDLWGRDTETTEVFLHEWQHQLEAFYSAKGVKLPQGGLHVDASYGYKHHPTMYWKPWYRDFLAGEVREPDGSKTGLGENAWSLGTIREEQLVFTAEYLTPELKQNNLLKDGSFEAPDSSAWVVTSWRVNNAVGHVAKGKSHAGQRFAVLDTDQADDATFKQIVTVKAKTKYLLCGWVKTENVTIAETGGTVGASLSILGGFERTPTSMLGTKDWTYLSFAFDSGDRTTIEVAARLGHHGSTASGKAWFDDLCLIELPTKKASTSDR